MTEKIKKQLEEAKSNEEIKAIIADNKNALTDEDLEKIAGGSGYIDVLQIYNNVMRGKSNSDDLKREVGVN